MALRLEQRSIDSFKNAMSAFLPKYLENDMVFPDHYSYKLGFLQQYIDWFTWTFKWTDIKYTDANFDIQDIKF